MDTKGLTQSIDRAADAAKRLVGKLERRTGDAKAAVDHSVERVQTQVVQGAKKGEHRVNETVERAAHRIQEAAHKLAHRAEEIADKLSGHAKPAAGGPEPGHEPTASPSPPPAASAEPREPA